MSSVLISRNGGAQTRIGGTQAAKESTISKTHPSTAAIVKIARIKTVASRKS